MEPLSENEKRRLGWLQQRRPQAQISEFASSIVFLAAIGSTVSYTPQPRTWALLLLGMLAKAWFDDARKDALIMKLSKTPDVEAQLKGIDITSKTKAQAIIAVIIALTALAVFIYTFFIRG